MPTKIVNMYRGFPHEWYLKFCLVCACVCVRSEQNQWYLKFAKCVCVCAVRTKSGMCLLKTRMVGVSKTNATRTIIMIEYNKWKTE